MNSMIESVPIKQSSYMPQWISTAMACIFALQWTFTMLPHTLGIHSIGFVIGAMLGAYIIIQNYLLLFQKRAMPIWLIFFLFIWMIFHLLFIGKNYNLQISELNSLWKRAALGVIFAIGLGISIAKRNQIRDWRIIIAGLCAPVVIYSLKYIATYFLPIFGITAPAWLTLFYEPAEFYVAKIAYVFFCIPLIAVSLGMLAYQFKHQQAKQVCARWFWVASILAVMVLFICENIKNGVIYSILLIALFLCLLLSGGVYKISKSNLILILGIGLMSATFGAHSLRTNPSWGTFAADFKVASQISPDVIWKANYFVYPKNKYGTPVSATNFDRVFYATTGLQLLKQNPFGYGLVQSSFGHLARERWPNAPLIQSHSGWLDLFLGIGIPGALLLLTASLLAAFNIYRAEFPGSIFGLWGFGSIVMLYATTEVAQKNYVDTFVWFIALVTSISLVKDRTSYL